MPIEGSLRDIDLHDIFQLVHLSRKTGELHVMRDSSQKRGAVFFRNGAVVGCTVNGTSPELGHLLLNAGKITQAQLNCAKDVRSQDPDRTWSEIFKSLGLISPQEMEKHLKFLIEESIYEILDWDDGRFAFSERPLTDSEVVTLITIESLLMEGARRADELSALPTTIESSRAVPRLSEAGVEGGVLDLAPEDWEVIGEVDGVRDVQGIAWQIGRSDFEVSKIISRLIGEGLVEVSSAPEPERTKPPHEVALDKIEHMIDNAEFGEADEKIAALLGEHPDEPRAHYLHARLLEKHRDFGGAARGYETTLKLDPLAEQARRRLGIVKLRLGDIEGAAREWEAYLRMVPETGERGDLERAMSALRELESILTELDGGERA